MPPPETLPSAEGLINETVEEHGGRGTSAPSEIISDVRKRADDQLPEEEQALVQTYTAGMERATEGMQAGTFEAEVAAYHDGYVEVINTETMRVRSSVEETVAFATYANEHESYHRDHNHTRPLVAGAGAHGEAVVSIGGETFDKETLVEAVTVIDTNGWDYVSEEYKGFADRLGSAINKADGISYLDVQRAVNETKRMEDVDDVSRQRRHLHDAVQRTVAV